MMYTATFDMGTTAAKGVLVSDDRKIVFQHSVPLDTYFEGDFKEQDPRQWYNAFITIAHEMFSRGFSSEDIRGIIMSGQMQDLIPLDAEGFPVRNAILYSDGRADREAKEISELIGDEAILRITGNRMDASIPAAKLLWYRKHELENYQKTEIYLGCSKDYITAQLCDTYACDVTAASTFGLMNIREKRWEASLLSALDISERTLPKIFYCHEKAGEVTLKGAKETGFLPGTPVYAGTGDAGASTLASGVSQPGEYSIYLGTSGWIASVSDDVLQRDAGGVFNLAGVPMDTYINVVPFLNAGGVHKWISGILHPEESSLPKYDYVDQLLSKSTAGSNGLLFLPYLSGERFPVMDSDTKGCYIGVVNETSKMDLARAPLEGVAYSIRQGLEAIGGTPSLVTLVGGGAKTPVWRQVLADVLDQKIVVPSGSEYLPALAIASSVLIAQGVEQDYGSFIRSIVEDTQTKTYLPDPQAVLVMEAQYQRFIKIHQSVAPLFELP